MKLRRGVTGFVIWPRRRVLELSRDHLSSCDRGLVAAASCLYEFLKGFKGFLYALTMCDSDSFVFANQRRKRNCFRCAESGVPTGAVFAGGDFLAKVIK